MVDVGTLPLQVGQRAIPHVVQQMALHFEHWRKLTCCLPQ